MKTGFDPLAQKYASKRFPIYALGGMVNCSSPQASAAGLEALRRGGNAIDAAVAAAAALTVVEPTSNGIGSDAFALLWSEKDQKLFGLNASGPAPMLASIGRIKAEGRDRNGRMPEHGWAPVTVPGAPAAWQALCGRFGRRSLLENLRPAISYAGDGYPCAPNLAAQWKKSFDLFSRFREDPVYRAWFDTFAPQGNCYGPGDIVRLPDHAATLEAIGASGAESFYRGELAGRIDEESRRFGGYLRYEDLAGYLPVWVEPLMTEYRGFHVCELPPNGQGIVALMALNILKNFEFPVKESPDTVHRQIEAIKMAFADAFSCVTDPAYMPADPGRLLSPAYGAARAAAIRDRAGIWSRVLPPKSGTVYLCTADGEGNMVSYIQSNYMGFGSGIVVSGTGISLQNRGADFSLDPGAANALMPGKRSYHTIMPGFIMKDGAPVGPFGVMGAYMQPQGHLQLAMNYIDFGLDPQQALDAPRWQWLREGSVIVENDFDRRLIEELRELGHDIRVERNAAAFGRGQMIVRLPNGALVGGTESRTDSNIACY